MPWAWSNQELASSSSNSLPPVRRNRTPRDDDEEDSRCREAKKRKAPLLELLSPVIKDCLQKATPSNNLESNISFDAKAVQPRQEMERSRLIYGVKKLRWNKKLNTASFNSSRAQGGVEEASSLMDKQSCIPQKYKKSPTRCLFTSPTLECFSFSKYRLKAMICAQTSLKFTKHNVSCNIED
jgi:hypothetical protein